MLWQWDGGWDQQQEYVFLYDTYKTLEAAVKAGQSTLACVKTDLQNAQLGLVGFLLEDLENIRVNADASTAILSGV